MPNLSLEKMFLDTYQTYSDAIFRFIFFKIDNRERALDLTQEAFMKAWLEMSKDGGVQNMRAFLYKVASNLVIDEYRRRGRSGNESLDDMREDGFEPKTENEIESLINKIDGEKIMEKIKDLPQIYSEVIFLKYTEELSISEMSENLGVSENVISVRINRGLKKLKQLVEDDMKKFNI